jgi:hypothetical protein
MDESITAYWLKHYATEHCTLCGNHGVIDSRSVRTPAGLLVGRLNYCICPNGLAMRREQMDIEAYVAAEMPPPIVVNPIPPADNELAQLRAEVQAWADGSLAVSTEGASWAMEVPG